MGQQFSQFIIHHWALCLALIIVLALTFINERSAQKQKGKALSPEEAVKEMNNDAVVIDLRDAEQYRNGHIIDAIKASSDDFEQKRMDKYKDKPIILVCPRGVHATTMATKLKAQGFVKPMVLAGGMAAWQDANLPVVKGK